MIYLLFTLLSKKVDIITESILIIFNVLSEESYKYKCLAECILYVHAIIMWHELASTYKLTL